MSAVVTERSLDEILELSEPYRTNALREWVGGEDPALIKANKAPWQVEVNGKTYKFTPSGRRVRRDVAVYLLLEYGKDGTYRKFDRKTGLSSNQVNAILARDDESTKYWNRRGLPTFEDRDNYLYHVPDSEAEDEE